ncbi:MAG: ABC transporter substrate-binding protein [Deltaproteobacteria bacterium]|nr:ABC transporter substrate-binding protein [Deltaproteobacteria bacterium]
MRKSIVALSLSCALLLPSAALAEGGAGAIDAFKQSQTEVTSLVDAKADAKELQAKVDTLLDYDWIATAALGGPKRFAERCTERCDEFKGLLTKLIRKNYLKRINDKNRGTVEYLKEHVRAKATKVDTKVTFTDKAGETKTVEIDYVMHKVDGQWHVRDMITEGVSLAKNYKYEINKLYKDGGMDKVITSLQAKVDELDAETP